MLLRWSDQSQEEQPLFGSAGSSNKPVFRTTYPSTALLYLFTFQIDRAVCTVINVVRTPGPYLTM
jgi:hypothetical protein